jgi:predicted nuclease of predicted toxin-antitoxin system
VKFIVDAQLPRRMVTWLKAAGCEAMHTFDLPAGNRSTDEQILDVTEVDQRILVTKDSDFVDSHLLSGRPAKLLLISTGKSAINSLSSLWCC